MLKFKYSRNVVEKLHRKHHVSVEEVKEAFR